MPPPMLRLAGALLVLAGFGVSIQDHDSWDVVVITLSRSHGVHVSDLVGSALLLVGLALLWHAARPGDAARRCEHRG
ncbi:MAG TPA: hypothetical protein VG265_05170 [Gaiellaceae bacterium]|nr:hypothetical protein [Gaiellaceae bacterium]